MQIGLREYSVAQADIVFEAAIQNREKYPFDNLQPCLATYHNCQHLTDKGCLCKDKLIRIYTYMCYVDPKRGLGYMKAAQKVQPDHPHVLNNIAFLYHNLYSNFKNSKDTFTKCLDLHPENAISYSGLGNLLHGVLGQINTAIQVHTKCVKNCPTYAPGYSDLIFCLHYVPVDARKRKVEWVCEQLGLDYSSDNLVTFSEAMMDLLWKTHVKIPPTVVNTSDGRGIAFVSADFGSHPVMDFCKVLLRDQPDIFVYNTGVDLEGERVLDATVRNISNASFASVLNLLKSDGIRVIIDLSGHTNASRHDIFYACQDLIRYCYLGYPSHTGIPGVVKISDAYCEEHTDVDHTVLLPNSFLCWTPRKQVKCQPREISEERPPVFGCFSKLCKISPDVIRLWKRLLSESGGSLVIKSKAFADPYYRTVWENKFEGFQVTLLCHKDGYENHLTKFADIDVHLDTFPYSGTTVTMESLYMDVPVVTLPDTTPESRVSADILHTLDLDNLIALNEKEYIEKAIEAAVTPMNVREKLVNSSLYAPTSGNLFRQTFYDTIVANEYLKQHSIDEEHVPML